MFFRRFRICRNFISGLYKSKAPRRLSAFGHDGYSARPAGVVFVENTVRGAGNRSVDIVIYFFEVGSSLEIVLSRNRRIAETVGVLVNLYAFCAAAVTFVESALRQSAF